MSLLKKLAGETAIYGLSSIVGRFPELPAGTPLHPYAPARGIRRLERTVRLRGLFDGGTFLPHGIGLFSLRHAGGRPGTHLLDCRMVVVEQHDGHCGADAFVRPARRQFFAVSRPTRSTFGGLR